MIDPSIDFKHLTPPTREQWERDHQPADPEAVKSIRGMLPPLMWNEISPLFGVDPYPAALGQPGLWFDCRPVTAGDIEASQDIGNTFTRSMFIAARACLRWSYAGDVSLDAMRVLDITVFRWLSDAIGKVTAIRDEAEKND